MKDESNGCGRRFVGQAASLPVNCGSVSGNGRLAACPTMILPPRQVALQAATLTILPSH
jgi:hypothetical protein